MSNKDLRLNGLALDEVVNGQTVKEHIDFFQERFEKNAAKPEGHIMLAVMRRFIIRVDGRIND